MGKYIAKRAGYMLITLFIIATFSFILMKLLPGSPLTAEEKITAAQRAIIEARYGLDEPILIQYFKYIGNLVQGDLGVSFQLKNQPVTSILMSGVPVSAQLGIWALLIGTFFGMLLGLLASIKHNTVFDYGANVISVLGISIPSFIFAGLLQYFVGVKWGLLPIAFWGTPEQMIMPIISLSIFPMAISSRFLRTEMIEVLGSDYMVTAKAKGVSNFALIFKHALRNALIPLITVMGPMAVSLMTGTLVIEQIFSVPGLGEQFTRGVLTNDYSIIMGTTLFFAFFFILVILIIDLLYGIVDPRIRLAGGDD
jgi:oligopeptide transport system permease protein